MADDKIDAARKDQKAKEEADRQFIYICDNVKNNLSGLLAGNDILVTVKGDRIKISQGQGIGKDDIKLGLTNLENIINKYKEIRLVHLQAAGASGAFPRFWDLFAFVLPRATRDRLYEPARLELIEDYTVARARYRTKWARRWLVFCFGLRTVLVVLDCFRTMLRANAVRFLWGLASLLLGGTAVRALRRLFLELWIGR